MKDYSNLFKDTFNKILKERVQARFVNKGLEEKLKDLGFEGHKLAAIDPFKIDYSEDFNCNFTYSFLIKDAKIFIDNENRLEVYNKIVSDIYCQQIAIVFENVINLFLKIFKQFRIENKDDFELLLEEHVSGLESVKEKIDEDCFEYKKIILKNYRNEIKRENLKSHQCIELLKFYLSSEINDINLNVATNKYLSQNIFEFLTFMKDLRNSIIHNDNIIKRNQNTHFKKYFIVEKLENDSEKISLDFEKTKKILEDYSFVVYLIYCALNLKYNNEDVLKIVHQK